MEGGGAYSCPLIFNNSNLFHLANNKVCKKKYVYHDYSVRGLYFYNDTIFPTTCKIGSNVYNLDPGESSETFPVGTSGTRSISLLEQYNNDYVYYTFKGFGNDYPVEGQYFGNFHNGQISSSAYFFFYGYKKITDASGKNELKIQFVKDNTTIDIVDNACYYTKIYIPTIRTNFFRYLIENYYYSLNSQDNLVFIKDFKCPVEFKFHTYNNYIPIIETKITDNSYLDSIVIVDKHNQNVKMLSSNIFYVYNETEISSIHGLYSKNILNDFSTNPQCIFHSDSGEYPKSPNTNAMLIRLHEIYSTNTCQYFIPFYLNNSYFSPNRVFNNIDIAKNLFRANVNYDTNPVATITNPSSTELNKQYYEFAFKYDLSYNFVDFINLPKYMFTTSLQNGANRALKSYTYNIFTPCVQILNYQNISQCNITYFTTDSSGNSVSNTTSLTVDPTSYNFQQLTNDVFSSNYFNVYSDKCIHDSNVYTVTFYNVDTSASMFTPDLYNSLGLFKTVAAENRIWGRLYYLYQSNKSIGIRVNGGDHYYINLFEGLWCYPNLIRNIAMSILHVNYKDYIIKIRKSDGTVLPIENCTYDDLNGIITMQVYSTTGILQKLEVIDYKGSAFKCPMFSNVMSDIINQGIQFTPFYYPVTSSNEILSIDKETGIVNRSSFDFIKFDLPVTQSYTFQNSGKYLSFINFDFNFDTPVEITSASSTIFSFKEASNIVSNNFGYDPTLGQAYPSNEYSSNLCTFIITGKFVQIPNTVNLNVGLVTLKTDDSLNHTNFTEACICSYDQPMFSINYSDILTKKLTGIFLSLRHTAVRYLESLQFTVINWDCDPTKKFYPKEINENMQVIVPGAITNKLCTKNITAVSTLLNNNYLAYVQNIDLDKSINVSQTNKYSLSVTSNNNDNLFYGLTLVDIGYSTPVYRETNDVSRNASLLIQDTSANTLVTKDIYTGASLIESPGMPGDSVKTLLPIVMPVENDKYKLVIKQENGTSEYKVNIINTVSNSNINTCIENVYNCQCVFTPLYNINDNYNSIQLGKVKCVLNLNINFITYGTLHNNSFINNPNFNITPEKFNIDVYKSTNATEAFEFDSSTCEITFYKKKYLVFTNIYCTMKITDTTSLSNDASTSGIGYTLGVKPVGPEYTLRKLVDTFDYSATGWLINTGRRSTMSICECNDSDIGVKQPFVVWGYTYAEDVYVRADNIQVLYIPIDDS